MSTLAHDCAPRGGNAAVLTANILKRTCSSYLGSRANVLRLPCCKELRELFLTTRLPTAFAIDKLYLCTRTRHRKRRLTARVF